MAQINLNDELQAQLENIVKESNEFNSVEEYVEYILKQVIEKKRKAKADNDELDGNYSKEDEDKIRERLKNLGYLD